MLLLLPISSSSGSSRLHDCGSDDSVVVAVLGGVGFAMVANLRFDKYLLNSVCIQIQIKSTWSVERVFNTYLLVDGQTICRFLLPITSRQID